MHTNTQTYMHTTHRHTYTPVYRHTCTLAHTYWRTHRHLGCIFSGNMLTFTPTVNQSINQSDQSTNQPASEAGNQLSMYFSLYLFCLSPIPICYPASRYHCPLFQFLSCGGAVCVFVRVCIYVHLCANVYVCLCNV